jgi:hydroxymethylglutaryl-CoA lyase
MSAVEIVEVGPRDGFQAVVPFIATEEKIRVCRGLVDAGVRRLEAGAFVSPKAIPQMADIREVLGAIGRPSGLRVSVLVPNAKGGLMALEEGVDEIVFVISVSEAHNRSNVRRSVEESFADLAGLLRTAPRPFRLRLNLATCFDCPFEGRIEPERVQRAVEKALALTPELEFGICDTTGRAFPDHVRSLMSLLLGRYGEAGAGFAFHGHDTYGLGITNALAAYEAGTRVFDAATGGLGGCPFAPGATGNTATEDLVFTFENMGIRTGIALDRLLAVADQAVAIPGASIGGHVRSLPRQRVLNVAPEVPAGAA